MRAADEKKNNLWQGFRQSSGLREFAYGVALAGLVFVAKEVTKPGPQPAQDSAVVQQSQGVSEQYPAARSELIAQNARALAANVQKTMVLAHETTLLARQTVALEINTTCQSQQKVPLSPGFKAVCDQTRLNLD